MEISYRFDRHQDPSIIHQNLPPFEKRAIKRQFKINPLQSTD